MVHCRPEKGAVPASSNFKNGKKTSVLTSPMQELIKVRGSQVSPSELEGVLLTHPDIIEAAIIGIPSPRGDDEVPRAYVVVRNESRGKLDEATVRNYMGERLARYKNCDGRIVFADEIPKTTSGKNLKRVLQE